MNSLFLGETEIIELTGAKQAATQRRWLTEHGYIFDVRIDGSIVVLRNHIEKRLGGIEGLTTKRRTEPDAEGLKKLMSHG